jgi:hypothetical protein
MEDPRGSDHCSEHEGGTAMTQTTEARLRAALLEVRSAILSPVNQHAITDTIWIDSPCPETVVDFIDWALEAESNG